MAHFINTLMLLGGIGIAIFSLAVLRHGPLAVATTGLGIGLVAIAFILDHRRSKRAKEKRSLDMADRIKELTHAAWPAHQSLQVPGSWNLAIIAMGIGFGSIVAIHVGTSAIPLRWGLVLGGAVFLAISVIAIPRTLASLFKPACILDRNGFTTPIHGTIPWHAVDGIYLQKISYRGSITYILFFHVEHYQRIVTSIHWTEKLLGLFRLGADRRSRIAMQLKDAKETPEIIEAVSRFLWKEATGRDYAWDPTMPAAFNDATRRIKSFNSVQPDAETIQRQRANGPQEVLAEFEQLNKDFSTIQTELARQKSQMSWLNWIFGITMVLLILGIAGMWLKNL